MKPLTYWQQQELLDSELRKPIWYYILEEKGMDLLRNIALIILDSTIKSLEDNPKKKKVTKE